MKIFAENRFTITKSLFIEGMLRVSRENYGKFAKKALAFMVLAWFLLAAATLWLGQSLVYVAMELVVLCIAGFWITVYMPRRKAKRAFDSLQNRGGLERVLRFYQDRLEIDASGTQKVVFYSEIQQILTAKRLLILVTEDKTGVLVKRDGFVCGSEAVVGERIRQAKAEN